MDIDIIIRNANLAELQGVFSNIANARPASLIEKKHNIKHKNTKWNIPIDALRQPKEYQRALRLCKKHNLPYPEAIKQVEETKIKTTPLPPENKKGMPHWKSIIKNTVNPIHTPIVNDEETT
jgi:hypothetical protein